MHKIWIHISRWVVAGVLYGWLEILFRGYTHWSMVSLAALLSIPLDICNEHLPWKMALWLQSVCGGIVITVGELVTGLFVNVWLGLGVWDYSNLWGNLWGQICVTYSLYWIGLGGVVIVAFDWLDYWMNHGKRPRYKWI